MKIVKKDTKDMGETKEKPIKQWQKNLYQLTKPYEKGIYEVEEELIEIAIAHAKFFLKRYPKRPEYEHWTQKQKRNAYVGLLGQKIFDAILQQLSIPSVRNDPALEWLKPRPYDFQILELGTIEVKTFDHYCRKAPFKVSEWHGNDYAVVLQFKNRKPTIVHIVGWLTGTEVENLDVSEKGEYYTPYEKAYITDIEDLNPIEDFFKKLFECSLETIETQNEKGALTKYMKNED
jgi:hypothetical protein